MLLNDRMMLGMDTADPKNRSEWRGRLKRISQQRTTDYETNMMMMMQPNLLFSRLIRRDDEWDADQLSR